MEYKRFENAILVRMDAQEDIVEQVKKVALTEHITLASVQALGALKEFTVGVYDVATMNGEYYSHLHLSAADDKGNTVGGHLNKAIISATCEMVITPIKGQIDRVYDDKTGLNLWKF